jgi:hypothetical protein
MNYAESLRRWKDNIKTYLKEIGLGCVAWINLAQDRDLWRDFTNTLTKLLIP